MRPARFLLLVAALISALLTPPEPTSGQGRENDLIKLAGTWWGTSVDRFPIVANLRAGEYRKTPHPAKPGIVVIVLAGPNSDARWMPKELPPFEFEFGENGLEAIFGFYKGTKQQVLDALRQRYGPPSSEQRVQGFVTYVWEFPQTVLNLTDVHFALYSNRARTRGP